MASPLELTPQERLAISRKAIVKHMNRHHQEADELNDDDDYFDDSGKSPSSSYGTLNIIRRALRVWWHRHPASAAIELASPLLSDYAGVHPFKLLGISAGAGAAIVVLRPWRMVSVGGLLVAAVKSSGLSNVLLSMLSFVTHHPEKTDSPP